MLNILDVKHQTLAAASHGQKALECPAASECLSRQSLGQSAKGNRLDAGLDLSLGPCFALLRLMFEPQIQCWQTGGRVAQGLGLGDTGS